MFSRRISFGDLASFCRVLRHNLGAGLPLVRVLEQQSQKGPRRVQPLAGRLCEALKQGVPFSEALARERDVLPPLFVDLAVLGEETGHLPEIFGELERYYQLQDQLRKQLRSQSILPAVQFVFAVFLIAGLLLLLGMLAPAGGRPLLTFFGLGGPLGALVFLCTVFGSVGLAWFVFVQVSRAMRRTAVVERLLLSVPVLGPCLQALALNRLALAMSLTLDSGLSIGKALRLSLNASGNAAYAAVAGDVVRALKSGESLYDAMSHTGIFPQDFLYLLASAEEGGRVPEMMQHQAQYYQEESSRRLTLLMRAAGMGVWLIYAGFMVWAIFSIAGVYFNMLRI